MSKALAGVGRLTPDPAAAAAVAPTNRKFRLEVVGELVELEIFPFVRWELSLLIPNAVDLSERYPTTIAKLDNWNFILICQ